MLEELSRQVATDIDDMILEKERADFARTWKGQLFNILGYLLSIYCIYRVIMVSFSDLTSKILTFIGGCKYFV